MKPARSFPVSQPFAAVSLAVVLASTLPIAAAWGAGPSEPRPEVQLSENAAGILEMVNVNGRTHRHGTFFQSLGTNGRTCATCHQADQGMSISPPQIRELYDRTHGRDPLFASVDGANCAGVRLEDRKGHSLLLKHGLIRVAVSIPAAAQFTISVIHDSNGCALAVDPKTGLLTASVYRRPLPATNLSFLSAVMWDGRETVVPLNDGVTFLNNLKADLTNQAISAVLGHAEGRHTPTEAQLQDIVNYELGLYSAQVWDRSAGALNRDGAAGGAVSLSDQQYYPGVNDVLGADPSGTAFNSSGMTLFSAWSKTRYPDYSRRAQDRRDIAAGEKLFNTAPLTISNVRGLNDNPALGYPASFQGTCTTCHDSPNIGNHSLPLPVDIGISHTPMPGLESDPLIAKALAELDQPDLPVFLINGCPNTFNPGQPASFYTTDPGKALVTGQCADLNRLKGPVLRGLAGRAPYFHNGAAATLMDAVRFYDQRFKMNLTQRQKEQLVAFLNAL